MNARTQADPIATTAPDARASRRRGARRWWRPLLLAALCLSVAPGMAQLMYGDGMRQRDADLLRTRIEALAAQRPGTVDLYAVGFAGDSTENVFRNEVAYFEDLMTQRFGAEGRTIALINHPDSLFVRPRPLATLENLRAALAGAGKAMDPDEDILLLFMTMHGTENHLLHVQMAPALQEWLSPEEIREALDASGIRHRFVVISACYSGGFIPALRDEHTAVLTAARSNRPSFGCGTRSAATYFGRAWMIEGLNETTDFLAAFEQAKTRIRAREKAEGFDPSLPQSDIGNGIRTRLDAWHAQLSPGPALPYPHTDTVEETDTGLKRRDIAQPENEAPMRSSGPRPVDKAGRKSGPPAVDDQAADDPTD